MDLFALENTIVVFNNHRIQGWSDDADAFSVPDIDLAAIKRGADGKMIAVSTGEKGGPVVIKLLANSPSSKFFQNIVTAQLNGICVTWNGIARYPLAGINVVFANGVLVHAPLGLTLGKGDIKNNEFTIEFETIMADASGATF